MIHAYRCVSIVISIVPAVSIQQTVCLWFSKLLFSDNASYISPILSYRYFSVEIHFSSLIREWVRQARLDLVTFPAVLTRYYEWKWQWWCWWWKKIECPMKKPLATGKEKMRSVFSPSWNDISFARRKEHFHPTNPTYELPLHCNIGGFLLPVWPIPPICREGDKNFLQKNTYLRRKGKMGQFPTHQFPNDKGQERIRPSHHRTATTQLWERRNNGCYSLILDPGRNYIVDNQQQINHISTLLASGKQGSIIFCLTSYLSIIAHKWSSCLSF